MRCRAYPPTRLGRLRWRTCAAAQLYGFRVVSDGGGRVGELGGLESRFGGYESSTGERVKHACFLRCEIIEEPIVLQHCCSNVSAWQASWGQFWGFLGGVFEASWRPLGGVLEAVFEPLGGLLGASWGPVGASWGLLRPLGGLLMLSGCHLGSSWAVLEPSWGRLGGSC